MPCRSSPARRRARTSDTMRPCPRDQRPPTAVTETAASRRPPGPPGRACCPASSRPADSFHFGNYLGALRQWVDLQQDYQPFFFIADLHAITVEQDPKVLRERTLRAAAQLLAMGIDPERSAIFVQSQVPEHAQLGWVLQCLTGFGEARRMTQFKDKSAKGGEGAASRRAVHLPDPPGRRHPALPPALRAGRRGPAPAPRADPRPRAAVQPPLQEDLPAARALHPQGDREDRRPAGPDGEDVEVGVLARPASSRCSTTRGSSAKKIRSAVTDSGTEIRFDPEEKPGISNLLTIYSALTGAPGRRPRGGVRRPRLRRPQEGPRRGRRRVRDAVPRRAPSSCSTTRPTSSDVLRAGRRAGRARSPRPRCATSTSGSASSAAPASRVADRAHDRSRARHPGALGQPAPGLPHRRRRHHRGDDPDPHHAGAADRGGADASCATIEEHLGEVAADARRRSASTCAAPAPSGRSRRWCS